MSELPSRAAFEAALNQPFDVGPFLGADGQPIPFSLVLVAVRELRPGGHPESFALTFRGPPSPMLNQGLYPFTRAPLGRFEIFVSPIGRSAEGFDYEAVFNRG